MTLYDFIIIGGGPAGSAAAVYSGRKRLKTLLITDSFGGQSLVSDSVENWIGTKKITGFELAKMLEDHVRTQEDVEIKMPERVVSVVKKEKVITVVTDKKNTYHGRSLLVASGGRRRRLNVPGEDRFEGKGVVYCSTCDAPLFRNKTVAVVGSGNAALEAVVDLIPYASKIYLLTRGNTVKGDPITLDQVKASEKTTIINNVITQEILGETVVKALRYEDVKLHEILEIPLQGVFVEIGSIPNTEFMKGVVEMNERNEIIMNHKTCETSQTGIFAAGDAADQAYSQNNISVGDAIKATLSAYNYLNKQKG